MKVVISTCDKYLHLMAGCAWLFNKYWGTDQEVIVLGFTPPSGLPANFQFYQLTPQEIAPWSTYMRQFVTQFNEPYFVFLFDDYWMNAPIDHVQVSRMEAVVQSGAHKGDLSANTHYFEHGAYGHDLVAATQFAQYRTSTQPAIWRRAHMLSLLNPGLNPWQFELQPQGTNDGALIVGPKTQIFKYANVYYKGKPAPYMLASLCDEDLEALSANGMMTMYSINTLRQLRKKGVSHASLSQCT